jgi:hypothetical protein
MGVGVAGVANYTNTSSGTATGVIAYGGVGGPYEYVSFFSVLNWFAKGEQGAWYDPSDLTSLFQESTGVTPMAAVGTVADQPVGLMLDKSKGLALGAELVTNGDGGTFDSSIAGITATSGANVSRDTTVFPLGGLKVISAGVNSGALIQSFTMVVGQQYKVTATLYAPSTNTSSNSASLSFNPVGGPISDGVQVSIENTAQTLMFVFTATSTSHNIYGWVLDKRGLAWGAVGDVAYFDNISVKQIAGNHAFQATSANRPILSARVNLLTKTEDFSDGAAWSISEVTAIGGTLTEVSTSNQHQMYRQVTVAANNSIQLAVKLSSGTRRYVQVILNNSTNNMGITVDTVGWVITNTVTDATWTATSPATLILNSDGTYTATIFGSCTTANPYIILCGATSATGALRPTYIGTGATIITKGIDLRPTNSGALLPPYQRVNTASDYDSVGFPLYLKCNGSSSAMSTNSIDFTATDKMTVVTGVRKLSDAARGLIFEFGSAGILGGFFVGAPPAASDPRYSCQFIGTSSSGGTSSGVHIAPETNVVTVTDTISDSLTQIRINAALEASNATLQGTGNFGNYPLYLFARAGTSLFFNGQFYGAIIRGAQSDTASVTQTENYMATKTGITF